MSAMPQRSIVDRMKGAAMLDVHTYEEVEADRGATGQAFVVVVIVAICAAIGGIGRDGAGILVGPLMAILGWLLWAGVTMIVGTRLFGGTADWGELLRTLGFAQSPGVFALLAIIPFLGVLVLFVIGIWQLVAGVIAIRQALDFSTGKAIMTAIVAWLVVMIVGAIVGGLFGLGSFVTGLV